MKKLPLTFALLMLITTGCSETTSQTVQSSFAPTELPETESVYEDYANHLLVMKSMDSFTAGIQNSYELTYSDGSIETYDFDGIIEVQNVLTSPVAHISQNINGNGLQSTLEGYYYNGRLYNNYNGVTYYEDMDYNALLLVMQTPITALSIRENEISDIQKSTTETTTSFTISLTDEAASSYFLTHYDISDLEQYENVTVTNGTIVQTFDNQGYFAGEEASFHITVTFDDISVEVEYHSSVSLIKQDATEIEISDELRTEQSEYVAFEDINTDEISDADIEADTPEDTVTETFAKRLVNRLNYELQEDGTYRTDYNENESYTVDFANKQFTYTNYSSLYVYNWAGDTGVFGTSCTYDFASGQASESCEESTIEMIETVKLYFEMELYYCGLSLSELVSEG